MTINYGINENTGGRFYQGLYISICVNTLVESAEGKEEISPYGLANFSKICYWRR